MQEENRGNKREQVFDLEKYVGKRVKISFFGGISVVGTLLGYDQLLNLVLEGAKICEFLESDGNAALHGLRAESPSSMVCKGASICSIELASSPDSAEQCAYAEGSCYKVTQPE
ncbi:U6 snRNA-associated Sm-like protein LSm7 [Nematocida major]|uniref:U6 snRNA-associated Sm-like protein LSm7 n=1 Tax=Nematocida major TaxID=1912982 RepID=UPI0020088F20|nr:U6 snRNA-associated Sm-like protein LSm7 [Nematocida major]KAH9386965.1 U6 snRNA-associated Sm-like protein LSm7 [Nematocida major]